MKKFKRKEYRDEKAQKVLKWWHQAQDERADWEEQRDVNWRLYTGDTTRIAEPWPDASNVHIPYIEKVVENVVPRLGQALFGTEPIANCKAVEPNDLEETDDVEQFLQWALTNDIANFKPTVLSWLRTMLIDSDASVKTTWEETWRQTRTKHLMPKYARAGETWAGVKVPEGSEPVELSDTDYIDHLLRPDPKRELKSLGDGVFECYVREGHKWVRAKVEIDRPDDEDDEHVDVYITKDTIVSAKPVVQLCNNIDLKVPYTAEDPYESLYLIHEVFLPLDTLAQRRDQGIYKFTAEEWQQLIDLRGTSDPDPDSRKQTQDEQAGVSATTGFKDGMFRILECYCYDDIDDDYRDEHMIYSVVENTGVLCRWAYLDEEFPHGQRPVARIQYIPIAGRYYGRSVCDILGPLQMEINAIFNLINDRENLINNPFFFYVPAANADPNQHQNVRPGQGIPVADANAFSFPNWGKNPLSGLELLQFLVALGEEAAGMGPMQAGQRRPGSAPRTARGTMAILSEGNIRLDMHVLLVQEGFKRLLDQIFSLYAEYMPEETYFRVMGENRPRKITREALRRKYDLILSGNTTNTNREVRQNEAMQLYQTLAQEPLYQQDLAARLELVRVYLRAYNTGNFNTKNLTPKLPVPLRPRDALEVIALLSQGFRIEPRQGEDPAMMMRAIEAFTATPEFESLPAEYVPLFAEAVQAYGALAQIMQSMQKGPVQPTQAGPQPASDMSGAQPGGVASQSVGMPLMGAEMAPPQSK